MRKISLENVKEFLELLWLNFIVKIRNFKEFMAVMTRYYRNIPFLKIDLSLLSSYLFKSPFEMSKCYLMKKGEKEIYAYGETPLTTLDDIAKQCQISSHDTVFELGFGRGRTCFWLYSFIHCKVIGIEIIPEFVEIANKIKTKYAIHDIEFRQGDIIESDYTGASVIYLYGICFEDAFIKKLIKKFQNLPKGTKIITISYPLEDYTEKQTFEVMKRFPAKFTWGEADVYLQLVK